MAKFKGSVCDCKFCTSYENGFKDGFLSLPMVEQQTASESHAYKTGYADGRREHSNG